MSGRFHGHVSPWSGIWTFFDHSHGKGGSCLGDCARDDLQPLPTLFSFVSCKFKGQEGVLIKAHFPRERCDSTLQQRCPVLENEGLARIPESTRRGMEAS